VRNAGTAGDLSEQAVADTQLLIGNGAGFTSATLSGDVTMTNAGVVSLAASQPNITSVGTLTNLDVDNININGNTISASTDNLILSDPYIAGITPVLHTSGTTISLTQADHANRMFIVDGAAELVITLPSATGTGDVYTIILNNDMTSTSNIVTSAASQKIIGAVYLVDSASSGNPTTFPSTGGAANQIDLHDGTDNTMGGLTGSRYKLTDIKTNRWYIESTALYSGVVSDPFATYA
jgi:hypothetical protein